MNKTMISLIILLIIGTMIGACGQLLIKKGLTQVGEIKIGGLSFVLPIFFKTLTNKFVFYGLLLSAVAALFWLTVLSRTNLNIVYPLGTALLCIAILVLSKITLKESMGVGQVAGTAIILAGITILSKFGT